MRSAPRRPASWILLALVAAVGLAGGREAGRRLAAETSLRDAPGGGSLAGLLTPGTAVEVVEEADGWARIRIEGWVPAASLEPGAGGPAPQPSTPVARPSTAITAPAPPGTATGRSAAATAGARLSGSIRLKLGRRSQPVPGAQVLMVPGVPPVDRIEARDDSQLGPQVQELEAEAARLGHQASVALRGSNFTDSTRMREDLLTRQREVLTARLELLAARNGSREAVAREAAAAAASTDGRGWFFLPPLPAGEYTIYARYTDAELDVEWLEAVSLPSSGAITLELDESGALGLPQE